MRSTTASTAGQLQIGPGSRGSETSCTAYRQPASVVCVSDVKGVIVVLGLGFIGWIVIGGLAGWIASKFMGTDAQMGIPLNIVVGIVGGLLGGFLLSLIGLDVAGGGLIFSMLTAILGACILLWLVRLVTARR